MPIQKLYKTVHQLDYVSLLLCPWFARQGLFYSFYDPINYFFTDFQYDPFNRREEL